MQINTHKAVSLKTKFYFLLCATFLVHACSENKKASPVTEKEFCESIHRNDSVSLTTELESVKQLMQTKTGVYVLEDGGTAMVTRAWLSEYAEQTIDIQYFIFSTDNVGLIACDYLVRAADRGVQVRLLVDDIMVDTGIDDILTLDRHKNISIKIYNPGVNLGKNIFNKLKKFATDFRGANQRMHNKTFVVDSKIVITGGRNIADEYFDYDHEYNFRDRDVLLLGKIASDVHNSFEQFWNSPLSVDICELANTESPQNPDSVTYNALHNYACNPENFWPQVREKIKNLPAAFDAIQKSGGLVWLDSVYFISDIPGKNDGTQGLEGGGVCTEALIQLIKNAKHTIAIQSPYLITNDDSRKLLNDAVARGVEIKILTNSLASTDNLEAFSGYQRDRKKLLATGVRIFEFRPDAAERYKVMTGDLQSKLNYTPVFGLHAKSMVIDGSITVIGTFNFDPRSANLNTECVAVIHSNKISTSVLNGMEIEFNPENSWETTKQWNPDSDVGNIKRLKTWTKKIVPKNIL